METIKSSYQDISLKGVPYRLFVELSPRTDLFEKAFVCSARKCLREYSPMPWEKADLRHKAREMAHEIAGLPYDPSAGIGDWRESISPANCDFPGH